MITGYTTTVTLPAAAVGPVTPSIDYIDRPRRASIFSYISILTQEAKPADNTLTTIIKDQQDRREQSSGRS